MKSISPPFNQSMEREAFKTVKNIILCVNHLFKPFNFALAQAKLSIKREIVTTKPIAV